ncbi:succinate dehydrogenase assembly factor 2 [Thalassospiraceae bacterium LMO-JJ14]|nr:succinate dehydrogenase assembly factor 2 [Thalassospiraceae bacterium LMO-JJ14]
MDARRKRLIYRATHCGMKENDVLLGRFALARLADLSESEADQFENLMNHSDNDLYNWVTGREPTPDMVDSPLLRMIKEFNGTL